MDRDRQLTATVNIRLPIALIRICLRYLLLIMQLDVVKSFSPEDTLTKDS